MIKNLTSKQLGMTEHMQKLQKMAEAQDDIKLRLLDSENGY